MWKIQCKIRLGECKSWTFTQNALFSGKIYTAGTIFHDRRSRRSWKISTLLLGLSKLKRRRFSVCWTGIGGLSWAYLWTGLECYRWERKRNMRSGQSACSLFGRILYLGEFCACSLFGWMTVCEQITHLLTTDASLCHGDCRQRLEKEKYIAGLRKVWNSQWKCLWVWC